MDYIIQSVIKEERNDVYKVEIRTAEPMSQALFLKLRDLGDLGRNYNGDEQFVTLFLRKNLVDKFNNIIREVMK